MCVVVQVLWCAREDALEIVTSAGATRAPGSDAGTRRRAYLFYAIQVVRNGGAASLLADIARQRLRLRSIRRPS